MAKYGERLLTLEPLPLDAPISSTRYKAGTVNGIMRYGEFGEVRVLILTNADTGQCAVQFLEDDDTRDMLRGEVAIISPFNFVHG